MAAVRYYTSVPWNLIMNLLLLCNANIYIVVFLGQNNIHQRFWCQSNSTLAKTFRKYTSGVRNPESEHAHQEWRLVDAIQTPQDFAVWSKNLKESRGKWSVAHGTSLLWSITGRYGYSKAKSVEELVKNWIFTANSHGHANEKLPGGWGGNAASRPRQSEDPIDQ